MGSGLTGLRCRQPETGLRIFLNCPMGPEPDALICVAYFLCSSEGTDARPEAMPSALPSPAQSPSPHGSPELRGKVSSLETGNSIRVTPTCKTETIALTRLGFPSYWRQLHFSGPAYGGRLLLPRIRQHNICFFQSLVKDRTGEAHLEALSEGSPHVYLVVAGNARLYLRLEWAHAAQRYSGNLQTLGGESK